MATNSEATAADLLSQLTIGLYACQRERERLRPIDGAYGHWLVVAKRLEEAINALGPLLPR